MGHDATNTESLKGHPVTLMTVPKCSEAGQCAAHGSYSNDNDTVIDLKDELNNVTVSFNYNATANLLEWAFVQESVASNHANNRINKNDNLDRLSIMNAKNVLLDQVSANFTIQVEFTNSTTIQLIDGASYDSANDVLSSA